MNTQELLKKKSQALKALEKYNKLKAEVETNCPHPQEHLVSEEKYYGAGYDYYSETHKWERCAICLAKINSTVTYGSHYS